MRDFIRTQRLFGNMRLRILAAMAVLLAFSYAVSLVLLRNVLAERLDVEIRTALTRELEEFRLLAAGTDPQTGQPFGDDLEAVFDLYYAREVPDEGETLLTFIDRAALPDRGRLRGAAGDRAGRADRLLARPDASRGPGR